jgi:hypothetical protein
LAVGEKFSLPINVSSAGQETLGTDVVILFDPKVLEAVEIKPGIIYPNYPEQAKDIDNVHGKIYFSGSTNINAPRVAEGELGEIFFRSKKAGETTLSFSWNGQNETTDSNIVPYKEELDLLSQEPASLTISLREASAFEKVSNFLRRIFSFDYLKF